MALDRQTIEKKDFPIGRRGYEPEAVDEHLAQLADQIDGLQRSAQRRSGASLAQAASEQVRSIVEAAEQSAQAIERDAEEQATRIREEAKRDAEKTDQEALDRSREHVSKVGEQSSLMLERVDAMETELGALVESLRTGANRLKADLALLESSMDDLYGAAGGTRDAEPAPAPRRPVTEEQPPAASPVATPAAPATAAVPPNEDLYEDDEPEEDEPVAAAPPQAARSRPAPVREEDGGDVEGARLIALNMALNGQSREETDRYLAENFDLGDRDGLLDEVYESVGG